MSASPIKKQPSAAKKTKKEPAASKKLQLLRIMQKTLAFLQLFTDEELAQHEDKLHVFVISKAQVLAKEQQIVDYVGVLAEGRAVSPNRHYVVGDLIGSAAVVGTQEYHPATVVAESQGLLVALRLEDVNTLGNSNLQNRLVLGCTQEQAKQLRPSSMAVWDEVDDKKAMKLLPTRWSQLFSTFDPKEQQRLLQFFPFLLAKKKDLILEEHAAVHLVLVVSGRMVLKFRGEVAGYYETGTAGNCQGFLEDHTNSCNVYCASEECVFWLLPRRQLMNLVSSDTLRKLVKALYNECYAQSNKQAEKAEKHSVVSEKEWSLFKKYDCEIVPLSKPVPNKPSNKAKPTQIPSINIYQSLFQEQQAQSKTKTVQSSIKQISKNYTTKSDNKDDIALQLQAAKKKIEQLQRKVKDLEASSKEIQLEMIGSKSKNNMHEVHRQIKRLYKNDEGQIQAVASNLDNSLISLKQAFDNQRASHRIQLLVAKCAYKWLQWTRERKADRKLN